LGDKNRSFKGLWWRKSSREGSLKKNVVGGTCGGEKSKE